jgi:hypothetical protein
MTKNTHRLLMLGFLTLASAAIAQAGTGAPEGPGASPAAPCYCPDPSTLTTPTNSAACGAPGSKNARYMVSTTNCGKTTPAAPGTCAYVCYDTTATKWVPAGQVSCTCTQ